MVDPAHQFVFLTVELVAIVWLVHRRPEPMREIVRMVERNLPWRLALMIVMPVRAAMPSEDTGPLTTLTTAEVGYVARDGDDRRDMREVYELNTSEHYPIDDRRID